jgi:hypothetical protein
VALANCAWSELRWQGDRWRMVRHNNAVTALVQARIGEHGDAAAAG